MYIQLPILEKCCFLAKNRVLIAYYDKWWKCCDQAVGWDSGTSDIYKQLLLKKNFQTMQLTPSQKQFTFRTLPSKSEKKNSSCVEKKFFFLQKWIAFGERIPKRYGTWGQEVRNLPLATPPTKSHTHHLPKSWNMTPDPKCYTFLESSNQMELISAGKSKCFCMVWIFFCKSCFYMSLSEYAICYTYFWKYT